VIADYRYKCRAVEVLDATTVIATIDLGFRHVVTIPLRLLALDEHEPGTDAYRRARRYLRKRVASASDVWVSTVEDADVPGSYACVLYADDRNLNVELVRHGLATIYDGGGKVE
jgi:endonuclease YncB( thermonuclease family)